MTTNDPTSANKIITFQQKSLDTALAYNTAFGIYIVPESGIYVFTWTIYGWVHTIASTELMINSAVAGKSVANSDEINDVHTSTGITVATVNKGDHVYVKFSATNLTGRLDNSYGGHCTFSGWKLD